MTDVHENTAYTNEDDNSVLCDKELCEEVMNSFPCKGFVTNSDLKRNLANHHLSV